MNTGRGDFERVSDLMLCEPLVEALERVCEKYDYAKIAKV